MDGYVLDETENQLDGAAYGNPSFIASNNNMADNEKTLSLNGTSQFVQLPYEIASTDAMTFTAWVNWRASATANQRIFDFGNGSEKYLYLTPSDGSKMSFVINDGNNTQSLSTSARLTTLQWKHVALTICRDSTVIYIDGEKAAHSDAINIMPSDINPVLNFIGKGQSSNDPFLKAYIEDVRIYNYALNADEVRSVMDGSTNGIRQAVDEETASTPSYYTLSGIRISKPMTKGTYIRKEGQKAYTIVIK